MYSSNIVLGRDVYLVFIIREGGGYLSRNWMRDSVLEVYRGDSFFFRFVSKVFKIFRGFFVWYFVLRCCCLGIKEVRGFRKMFVEWC